MNLENSFLHSGRHGIARKHPNGSRVVMFLDMPGMYYTEHGDPVEDDGAKAAGFDVAALGRDRSRREKLAEAKKKIDAQYDAEGKKIDAEEAGGPPPDPIDEDDSSEELATIVRMGRGTFNVIDVASGKAMLKSVSRVAAEGYVMAVNARGEVFDPAAEVGTV
jgi:hypothetical protein